MSALWLLGLGASVGYMAFQRQAIEGRLDLAVKEWESGTEPSVPKPPDGSSMKEIKSALRYTADTRNMHFNERIPDNERAMVLALEDAASKTVTDWDRSREQAIEGVYLEPSF